MGKANQISSAKESITNKTSASTSEHDFGSAIQHEPKLDQEKAWQDGEIDRVEGEAPLGAPSCSTGWKPADLGRPRSRRPDLALREVDGRGEVDD